MNRKVVPFLIFVILLVLALVTINVITSNKSPKVKSLAITTPEDTPVSIIVEYSDVPDFCIEWKSRNPAKGRQINSACPGIFEKL